MKSLRTVRTAGLLAGLLILAGCGFRPIYATAPDGAPPLNQLIAIRHVKAPDTIKPLITDALNDRILLRAGQRPRYDLYVDTKESAERLAVQIDATVTRYNYRLRAKYTLVNLETGQRRNGSAQAVTSYNIVSSQYSTLYAERTAQEKASRLLAEEIERDLLIQFSEGEAESDKPESLEFEIDGETNFIVDTSEDVSVFDKEK